MTIKKMGKNAASIFLAFVLAVGMITPALATDTADGLEQQSDLSEDEYIDASATEQNITTEQSMVNEDETEQAVSINDDFSSEKGEENDKNITYYDSDSNYYEYAIYSSSNSSLTFYSTDNKDEIPVSNNDTTTVYTDFIETDYQNQGSESIPWYNFRNDIKTVTFDPTFEKIQPTSMAYWFMRFTNLSSISGGNYVDTSQLTSLYYTFSFCTSLTDISALSGWNTSNVTNLSGTFDYCTNITSFDAISNWETSNVTTMNYAFYECGMTDANGLSGWKTDNLKSLFLTFAYCDKLKDISGLSSWDTSNVTNFIATFDFCASLEKADISSWVLNDDAEFSPSMFGNCSSLNEITINLPYEGAVEFPTDITETWYAENGKEYNYDKIPAGKNTYYAGKDNEGIHYSAEAVYYYWDDTNLFLTSDKTEAEENGSADELTIDGNASPWTSSTLGNGVSSVSDITSVTIMNSNGGIWPANTGYLFAGFVNASFNGLEYLHTDYTTNMNYMFQDCDGLTQDDADLIAWFNTENCQDMAYMFSGVSGTYGTDIENLDLSRWDMSNVTNMNSMFANMCGSEHSNTPGIRYITLPTDKFKPNPTNMEELFSGDEHLYAVYNIESLNAENVTSLGKVFYDCEKLTTLDLSNWDVSKVTSLYRTFSGCSNVTSINVSSWNTENNTNLNHTFSGCDALESLDVSNWDTSNVTTMQGMFYASANMTLTGLDVSGWDTSNVTDMSNMFYCPNTGTSYLTYLDVSNWNTSNVTDMNSMFRGCKNLTVLDVSNWDTSKVVNMEYMFEYCSSLTGTMDLSGWDVSSVGTSSDSDNKGNIAYMFRGCSGIEVLDLSGWDTSNAVAMQYMFYGCTNLKTIYASENQFVLNSKVAASSNSYGHDMFTNCVNLVGGNGTEYNDSKVDCTMAHVDTASNHGYFTLCEHKYTEEIDSYDYTDITDLNSYTFSGKLVCMKCGDEVTFTSEDNNVTVRHEGKIDCTATSQIIFTIGVDYNGKNYSTIDEININAQGHQFSGDGYWTLINGQSDNVSCTAYYVCDVCGEEIPVEDINTEKDNVKSIEPTCTEDGENVFEVTGQLDNGIEKYIDVEHTLTETLSAFGHDWGEITFIWNDDYSNASAFRTCIRCGETETANRVSISHRTTEPTCTEDGEIVYTATATFSDGTSVTDSKAVDIPATGHVWTFNQDDNDSYIINLSGGWMQFILTCSVCGETYTTARVNLTFETYDTYEGQAGITYCTAKITIGDKEYEFKKNINEVSAQAEQVMNAHAWYEYSTKACTCTTNGVVTYKCSDCGATKDVIETAKGHDWDEDNAQWNWSSNYSKCTVTAKCLVCGHSDTESCTVTTATSGNNTMYTAVATMDDGQTLRTTTTANASAQTTHSGNNSVSSSPSGNNGNTVNSDEGTTTSVNSTAADDTVRDTADTASSETATNSADSASSSDSDKETTADSTSGAKTGEIIAFSVVGAIIIVAIIVLIVTLVSRRRKATANGADDLDEDDEDENENDNE